MTETIMPTTAPRSAPKTVPLSTSTSEGITVSRRPAPTPQIVITPNHAPLDAPVAKPQATHRR